MARETVLLEWRPNRPLGLKTLQTNDTKWDLSENGGLICPVGEELVLRPGADGITRLIRRVIEEKDDV